MPVHGSRQATDTTVLPAAGTISQPTAQTGYGCGGVGGGGSRWTLAARPAMKAAKTPPHRRNNATAGDENPLTTEGFSDGPHLTEEAGADPTHESRPTPPSAAHSRALGPGARRYA